jgi:NADH:ubiquinone oxidoreductase subunit 3 (subunit A)
MLNQWLYIGIFFIIAMALPAVAIFVASILAPKKPNKLKNSVYECGIEPYETAWIQYRLQYYLYGLIFLIFDVEVVFLFPFAVVYNKLALFAVIEAFIFILILLGGYLYIWRKGALNWQL